jgi:DNA-binding transcriptional regulator GbsR (MarR family)
MSGDHQDVRAEIAQIKDELARLRAELDALKQERAGRERIKQRMTELKAELRLYEIEQELAGTQAKQQRRRFFKKR